MPTPLDEERLGQIQHELEGTCESLDAIIDRHDLDIDADGLEDRLLDAPHPVERSTCCEWWFAVSDLEYSEERAGGVCDQCEPFEP